MIEQRKDSGPATRLLQTDMFGLAAHLRQRSLLRAREVHLNYMKVNQRTLSFGLVVIRAAVLLAALLLQSIQPEAATLWVLGVLSVFLLVLALTRHGFHNTCVAHPVAMSSIDGLVACVAVGMTSPYSPLVPLLFTAPVTMALYYRPAGSGIRRGTLKIGAAVAVLYAAVVLSRSALFGAGVTPEEVVVVATTGIMLLIASLLAGYVGVLLDGDERILEAARTLNVGISADSSSVAVAQGLRRSIIELRNFMHVIANADADEISTAAHPILERMAIQSQDPPDSDEASALMAGQAVLTERRLEVAHLKASGYSVEQIAATLCISPNTVKRTLSEVSARIGTREDVGILLWFWRQGALDLKRVDYNWARRPVK